MDLTALLAADPEAQAQYDANIKAHGDTQFAAGETAGKEASAQAWEQAAPILASDKYPESVKKRVMVKAKAGDSEGLADFVAIHDMNVEASDTNTAAGETDTTGETTGSGAPDSSAEAQANYSDRKNRVGGL